MKVLILISIIGIATSCHQLHDGVVIKKEVEPARRYIYMHPIPHRIGKITTYTYIPVTMYDDEDYVVTIDGFTDSHEERVEAFYVSKSKFECLKKGDHFYITEDCSTSPNDDEKQ